MSLRTACFCLALATMLPASAPAFAQATAPSTVAPSTAAPAVPPATGKPAGTPPKATNDANAKPASGTPAPGAPASPKTTPAQAALHQRQTTCGAEWRAAKAAGKIPAGQTWPKYWSACNTRLKAQGK